MQDRVALFSPFQWLPCLSPAFARSSPPTAVCGPPANPARDIVARKRLPVGCPLNLAGGEPVN